MSTPNPQFRFNPLTGKLDLSDVGGGGEVPYPGGVVAWVDVDQASVSLANNTGYTVNHASLCTLTLPAVCPYGTVFRVVGKNVGGWKIAQSAGQIIHFGTVNTTVGTSGYLQNSAQFDAVELLCTITNMEFTVINCPIGGLNYN